MKSYREGAMDLEPYPKFPAQPPENRTNLAGDRTQNAHRICNQSGLCGVCGSWNQQLADNKARGMVQLRPWPPYFQLLASAFDPDYVPICSNPNKSRAGLGRVRLTLSRLGITVNPLAPIPIHDGIGCEDEFRIVNLLNGIV